MSNEQLIADLKETRTALEVNGRCHGDLRDDSGRVCLDGAIILATQKKYKWNLEYTLLGKPRAVAVMQALYEHLPESFQRVGGEDWWTMAMEECLYMFNDDVRVTDSDVFTLVDKALAQAGGLA